MYLFGINGLNSSLPELTDTVCALVDSQLARSNTGSSNSKLLEWLEMLK